MSLVRTLCCSVGGFGMLLFTGTALDQADITTGSIGTTLVETRAIGTTLADTSAIGTTLVETSAIGTTLTETSAIGMSAVDSIDECRVAQICIDRYLWSLYE